MKRIYILVEGQTEEAFISELLAPHYAPAGLYLIPIIASTGPKQKGGVTRYAKVRPQIVRLCRQDSTAGVSTLMDLYALPSEFPGHSGALYPSQGTGRQKAEHIETEWGRDINEANFLPHLMVHEYEALLFTQPQCFAEWTDEATVDALVAISQSFATPEDINDGPLTAPSKRIKQLMPQYQKTFHGPLIACDIGLDVLREACPHFNDWLLKLEQWAA